jgi:hypothetical protein
MRRRVGALKNAGIPPAPETPVIRELRPRPTSAERLASGQARSQKRSLLP